MIRLRGPERAPASGGAARGLVVLLHGFGADGNDLVGLADHWAGLLPDCRFLSPHAPEPCDMAPAGRQWFPLRDRAGAAARTGVDRAAAALDSFLDEALEKHGLADDRLALAGFSQGTMTALHTALRRPRPPACVLGYSGRLIDAGAMREGAPRPPVMLVHGDADEMVPVGALHEAVSALGAAGVSVQWHISRGTGHGIAPDGLAAGGRFLRDHLARRPGPAQGLV